MTTYQIHILISTKSIGGYVSFFFAFLTIIEIYPVLQFHHHQPRGAGAAEEYGGEAITKAHSVPLRLVNPVIRPQLLRPLALDMDAG